MKGYRTDENGRWSPSYTCEVPEPGSLAFIGGIVLGCMFAIILAWWFL